MDDLQSACTLLRDTASSIEEFWKFVERNRDLLLPQNVDRVEKEFATGISVKIIRFEKLMKSCGMHRWKECSAVIDELIEIVHQTTKNTSGTHVGVAKDVISSIEKLSSDLDGFRNWCKSRKEEFKSVDSAPQFLRSGAELPSLKKAIYVGVETLEEVRVRQIHDHIRKRVEPSLAEALSKCGEVHWKKTLDAIVPHYNVAIKAATDMNDEAGTLEAFARVEDEEKAFIAWCQTELAEFRAFTEQHTGDSFVLTCISRGVKSLEQHMGNAEGGNLRSEARARG